MSCCGSQSYCTFHFPEGPPLTDHPVSSLEASYLFLPYGTLLKQGDLVRIWTENGQTRSVIIQEKTFLEPSSNGLIPISTQTERYLPWQLIALDSNLPMDDILHWPQHPLYNPETQSVVLKFKHPTQAKRSLKQTWLKWLYKIRTL